MASGAKLSKTARASLGKGKDAIQTGKACPQCTTLAAAMPWLLALGSVAARAQYAAGWPNPQLWILFPLVVPVLLAAVKATSLTILGDPMGQTRSWILLLVCFNLIHWSLGGLLFGFDTAVISGTTDWLRTEFNLNTFLLGFTVASALIGTIIGSIAVGKPADSLGRRGVLFALAGTSTYYALAKRSVWVGDRKQCIFEYAGADPQLMLDRDNLVWLYVAFALNKALHELGHAIYDKYHDPNEPWLLREPAHPFTTGQRVFHQKFGYGHVAKIDGNKLTIAFDKAGEKKVVDSFVERA